jgi:nicotinamidase-related amidase
MDSDFLEPRIFELFGTNNTAIIVIDKQTAYANEEELRKRDKSFSPAALESIAALDQFIIDARQFNVPLVWTKMIEDVELSPPNIRTKMQIEKEVYGAIPLKCVPNDPSSELCGQSLPASEDYIITKYYYSAFANTDLHEYLQNLNITSIVIVGGFASRCVLATAFAANSHGYNVLVPKDLVFLPEQFEAELKPTLSIINGILGFTSSSQDLIEYWRNNRSQ